MLNEEARKKLRGVYDIWKAHELLVKEYSPSRNPIDGYKRIV